MFTGSDGPDEPEAHTMERHLERYDFSLSNPAGPGHDTHVVPTNEDGSPIRPADTLEGITDALQLGLVHLPETLENLEIKACVDASVLTMSESWGFEYRDEICLVQWLAQHLPHFRTFQSKRCAGWRKVQPGDGGYDWMGPPRPLLVDSTGYKRVRRAMKRQDRKDEDFRRRLSMPITAILGRTTFNSTSRNTEFDIPSLAC
ncbi:hypothetical protein HGRIS_001686 [Hohenbuehelia grisea]|uniref:Uncharacterized protein n=1 Tax=Hohenbuehelia grisea TaxID=104357 RepID=A0ABR3JI80_9AGAR